MKDGIVVLTPDQLRTIVTEAVEMAMAKAGPREDHDILDAEQCADLLGVVVRTLPKLIHDDGLPTLRSLGKLRRFSRREVLAWMVRRKSA